MGEARKKSGEDGKRDILGRATKSSANGSKKVDNTSGPKAAGTNPRIGKKSEEDGKRDILRRATKSLANGTKKVDKTSGPKAARTNPRIGKRLEKEDGKRVEVDILRRATKSLANGTKKMDNTNGPEAARTNPRIGKVEKGTTGDGKAIKAETGVIVEGARNGALAADPAAVGTRRDGDGATQVVHHGDNLIAGGRNTAGGSVTTNTITMEEKAGGNQTDGNDENERIFCKWKLRANPPSLYASTQCSSFKLLLLGQRTCVNEKNYFFARSFCQEGTQQWSRLRLVNVSP